MKKLLLYSTIFLILLGIASLLIWFGGPYLVFKGWIPLKLKSHRIYLIILFFILEFIATLALFIYKKKAKTPEKIARLKTQIATSAFQKDISTLLAEIKKTKFLKGKTFRSSYDLPWYLIIGAPGSGKSTLLKHSGLNIPLLKHFKKWAEKKNTLSWLVTDKAIFLEISRLNVDEDWDAEINKMAWLQMLKILKKYKSGKPINGVIVATDIAMVLEETPESTKRIQGLRKYLLDLYLQLKTKYPVYAVFTKCDQIKGFSEYFNNHTPVEREQVFGLPICINDTSKESISQQISVEYDALLTKLDNQIISLLNKEQDLQSRQLICFYPQQMLLLKPLLLEKVEFVFGPDQLYRIVNLRGIFFTSSQQDSTRIFDLLGAELETQFQLLPLVNSSYKNKDKSYFIQNLFQHIIIPDADLIDRSRIKKRFLIWATNAKYVIASLITIISILLLKQAYFNDKQNLLSIKNNLQTFSNNSLQLKDKNLSLTAILPLLAPLKNIITLEKDRKELLTLDQYSTPQLKTTMDETLNHVLKVVFIPRLYERLETILTAEKNNPDTLYSAYKAYLFLGDPKKYPSTWFKNAIVYDWLHNNASNQPDLQFYLNFILKMPINPFNLNNNLVASTKDILQNFPLDQNIFQTLKEQCDNSNLPTLDFTYLLGNQAKTVFVNYPHIVPAFFTKNGYINIYAKNLIPLTKNTFQNALLITPNTPSNSTAAQLTLIKNVNALYTHAYMNEWKNLITNLKIAPFTSLEQGVNELNAITAPSSPFILFFITLNQNTNFNIAEGNLDIQQEFSAINNVTTGTIKDPSLTLQSVMNTLNNLNNYLNKINQSSDIPKASFLSAQAIMRGDTTNPISTLYQLAAQEPAPLNNWLYTIADNSWLIILKNSRQYINTAWQTTVLNKYQSLQTYYPFNSNAPIQARMSDFSGFYGKKGTLNTFFQTYLKDFLVSNTKPFTWNRVNGHSLDDANLNISKIEKLSEAIEFYFPTNAESLSIKFTLQPINLTANAASIKLELSGQTLTYRHGPPEAITFIWPHIDQDQVKFSFNDFDDQSMTKSFDGPWSIFKLFRSCQLQATSQPDHYILTIRSGSYTGTFDLTMENAKEILTLASIENTQLPAYI